MSTFGFLAHPINEISFYDLLPFWGKFHKFLPKNILKKIASKTKPYRLCRYEKVRSLTGDSVKGDLVMLSLSPIQLASMKEDEALDLVEYAINLCEKYGDQIVALGAFTSVVGNEGEVLSKRVKVPLTSGNTLTASLALDGIYKAAKLMGVNLSNATAAIIGATGDVGSICTKVLSKKVKKLNIAARNEKKLEDFANVVRKYGIAQVDVYKYTKDAVKDADIVLTATSSVTTVIEPQYLKSGAIVCDVALPANIAKEVVKVRNDVLVFEGGLAKLLYMEDIWHKSLINTVPARGVYGCFGEGLVLTLEEKFEPFSLGRGNITEEKLVLIKSLADKHGVVVSDFFCGYKFFTDEDIEQICLNAKRKKT